MGNKVFLRRATHADKRNIFEWLAHSDLTSSMMGPPIFSDHPIPVWEEFSADYCSHYFDGSKPRKGRCFIIVADDNDVGVVCYNALKTEGITDVDIWLRSEAYCGKGFGSDALKILTDYLNKEFRITKVVISPSARNYRAIAAYRKAGFRMVPERLYHRFIKPEEMEYEDNIVLVKDYV